MRKATTLTLFALIINGAIYCQNTYYYYKGQKRQLEINYNCFYVVSKPSVNHEQLFKKHSYEIEKIKEV